MSLTSSAGILAGQIISLYNSLLNDFSSYSTLFADSYQCNTTFISSLQNIYNGNFTPNDINTVLTIYSSITTPTYFCPGKQSNIYTITRNAYYNKDTVGAVFINMGSLFISTYQLANALFSKFISS